MNEGRTEWNDRTNDVAGWGSLVMVILVAVISAGFTPGESTITVKGSDTMVILAQRWAKTYMKSHPETVIQVTGGGSGTGISALINGSTDICNSSRHMNQREADLLRKRYGSPGVEVPCAKDQVSIYVNASNPVAELTFQQLSDIFSGKIRNWKEVGGRDMAITLYGRENSSGTYIFFKERVIKQDYAAHCQTLPGTAAVVNAVSNDEKGIGYGGAVYALGVKYCAVKRTADDIACTANAETMKNGHYPISRYLFMYLKKRPEGDVKAYIDWILSPEGQKLIEETGFFPVR
jgi:phosphate transport system substrate-binding protein